MKEDKNEKARKVPLRAYQKVADHELPGYTRLRKIKERLRKQGKSKEEIERRIGEEIKLTNPVSLEELLEEKGFEVVEFVDKDTTRTGCDVEFAEKDDTRERIKIAIVEYINGLAPQAEPQKVVGKFLLEKLNLGEIEDYVKETKERFRIDTQKVHKASGISLRTVERFYEGLMKFYRQKKLR